MMQKAKGVWWVNMPDFTSYNENIQVKELGSSTNGSSAFGASINLKIMI